MAQRNQRVRLQPNRARPSRQQKRPEPFVINLILIQLSRREVETSEGESLADELKFEFYETSAKTGKNTELIFKRIAENVLQKIESKQINL